MYIYICIYYTVYIYIYDIISGSYRIHSNPAANFPSFDTAHRTRDSAPGTASRPFKGGSAGPAPVPGAWMCWVHLEDFVPGY